MKKSDNFKENIVPMEEDTIFDLASVTKLFTAISILKLVEMGDVKLGDDITKYVPQFDNLKGVSIFNLLTFIPLKTDTRIDKAKTKEEAENILFGAKRIDSPSIGNPYNDIAPMVLKYVIENVSGLSYYDFLEKFVLKDVNMRDTLVKECGNREKFASGNFDGRYYKDDSFLIRDKAIPGVSTDDKARILGQAEGNLSGHAGLFSTASDMEKMARGLIDSKIINERARNSMAKNRTGRLFCR